MVRSKLGILGINMNLSLYAQFLIIFTLAWNTSLEILLFLKMSNFPIFCTASQYQIPNCFGETFPSERGLILPVFSQRQRWKLTYLDWNLLHEGSQIQTGAEWGGQMQHAHPWNSSIDSSEAAIIEPALVTEVVQTFKSCCFRLDSSPCCFFIQLGTFHGDELVTSHFCEPPKLQMDVESPFLSSFFLKVPFSMLAMSLWKKQCFEINFLL